jgi:hypothetical protein
MHPSTANNGDMDPHNYDHRWATITRDDHGGIIYIVAFLGLTYSSLTSLVRYFIRLRTLGLDDLAMFLAQVCFFWTCQVTTPRKLTNTGHKLNPVLVYLSVLISRIGKSTKSFKQR